jgi:hypothetical protein
MSETEQQTERLREALDEMNLAIEKLRSSRRRSLVKDTFEAVLNGSLNVGRPGKPWNPLIKERFKAIADVLHQYCDQTPSGQPENPLVRDLARWNEFNVKLLS